MTGDFTFLKGNIEPIILNSLYNGDKYGYEIAKEIKEKTSNNYEIKHPTLYSYLKKLENQDLITSYWGAESNGGRRRYYALTKIGRANFEQYYTQWQHQRNVMDALVDTVAVIDESAEIDSTLLLRKKSKKISRPSRLVTVEDIDSQSIIAEQLLLLSHNADAQISNTTASIPTDMQAENILDLTNSVSPVSTTPTPITVSNNNDANANSDSHDRFELHQDNVDVFMQDFVQRANVLSSSDVQASDSDYQETLLNIVGSQLDEMEHYSLRQPQHAQYNFSTDRPQALEEVADELAKQGVRMRIFNRTTAVYHPKKLVPASKIACITAWTTYIATCIILTILGLVTYQYATLTATAVVMAILAIVPLALTVRMISDPTRKPLKKQNYKVARLSCLLVFVAVVMLSIGINVMFLQLKFSNIYSVVTQIIIPSTIAISPLVAVMISPRIIKKYS